MIREVIEAPDGRFTITGDEHFRTDDFQLACYVIDALYEQDKRGELERKPGVQNWIERLPAAIREAWDKSIIYRAATHMVNEHGMEVGHAIASALNWCKHICATGDVKQWPGPQHVRPSSQAECCAAVALWESMKSASHAKTAAKK
jgi:hypothetical protein